MNLTIEKAKEIVELYGPHAIEPISQADGFIDGWNQAIDEIIFRFDMKLIIYSTEAKLLREIKELKVNVEK